MKSEGFGYEGYMFHRMTHYCGKWIKHSGWYPDRKLRLFDKNKGEYKGVDPHDVVLLASDSKARNIAADLLHYSYHSIEEHMTQMNKFTTVSAEEKLKKGKRVNVFIHLIIYPFWTFFKTYILKLGILDGYQGFVISTLDMNYKFLKYIKLRELIRKANL